MVFVRLVNVAQSLQGSFVRTFWFRSKLLRNWSTQRCAAPRSQWSKQFCQKQAYRPRSEWHVGRRGRKAWLKDVAERRGWKTWPEGVTGRRGRKAWPEGVVGRRGRKAWSEDVLVGIAGLQSGPFAFSSWQWPWCLLSIQTRPGCWSTAMRTRRKPGLASSQQSIGPEHIASTPSWLHPGPYACQRHAVSVGVRCNVQSKWTILFTQSRNTYNSRQVHRARLLVRDGTGHVVFCCGSGAVIAIIIVLSSTTVSGFDEVLSKIVASFSFLRFWGRVTLRGF